MVPKDATDLYAYGVEYCQSRGIPLPYLRIDWCEEDRRYQWVPRSQPIALDTLLKIQENEWLETKRPEYMHNGGTGCHLWFPNKDEATEFGLGETSQSFGLGQGQFVFLQPPHKCRIVAFTKDGILVSCQNCGTRPRLQWDSLYNGEHYHTQIVGDRYPGKIVQLPPFLQMPVCIQPHQFDLEVQREIISLPSSDTQFSIVCERCGRVFAITKNDVTRDTFTRFHPEKVRQLGRCLGASPNTREKHL